MEWRYRGMMDKDGVCTIREVFYEPDGTISSFAVDPAVPTGDSPDELVSSMALMLESLQQPFLLEGDFIPEGDGELEFTFIREDENKYH
jgi:hypothetical protein|tara:strand:+ start:29 stop:295 length:267 start_codon:yes stop_codon:yes gene_type:complete